MTELTLAYDMRSPNFGAPTETLYRAAIEQCAWADRIGFDGVMLMEHHATTHGYLPSPITLASAIAATTQRLLIRIAVLTLPLYDPLRVAEDLSVLDLISGGRLRLTVGMGYRAEEYAQFGIDMKRRADRMDEAIEVLKQAWTGEPFDYRGRTVQILPRPLQRPRPAIHVGGTSEASARRAARLGDGYDPFGEPGLYARYRAELVALGKPEPRSDVLPGSGGGAYVFVSDDVGRDWARIAPHAMHDRNEYARWISGRFGSFELVKDHDELRKTGRYRVVTPTECIQLAKDEGRLTFKPLVGGLAPEVSWQSLELFADRVLPGIQSS